MFTGLIEEIGTLAESAPRTRSRVLTIAARKVLEGTAVGDSIAVNGACLTVTEVGEGFFRAEAVAETLRATNLGALRPGHRVNLERALHLGDRLHGHLVSGHIDGIARLGSIRSEGDSRILTLTCPRGLLSLVAPKGSVALDGTSLTVSAADRSSFSVAVIPHTAGATTLCERRPGDDLNLECDLVARYLARLTEFDGGCYGAGFDRRRD